MSPAQLVFGLPLTRQTRPNLTTNHIVDGQINSPEHEGQRLQTGSYRLFPRSNLAYIPGAINALIVLTDCTTSSAPDSIRGSGYEIPVASAMRRASAGVPLPVPTPVDDLVGVWWVPFEAAAGGSDIITAINEIESKLAIDGVARQARAVAAELHGAQYPSVMVHSERTGYDPSEVVSGGWVLGGGPSPRLYPGSRYFASELPIDADTTRSRRLMVGYNFGGLSPLARPYTGETATQTVPSVVEPAHRGRVWTNNKPDNHAPAMTLKTMDSMSRVATYMGLVITEDIQSGFTSAGGARGWFRMLVGAITLQTSLLFARSDLSLRVWAGYEAESTDLVTRNTYTQYIRMATNGLCGYVDIKMMIAPWFTWDEECTAKYYGMDLLNDTNWLSYHPVPAVLTTQWSRKLELSESGTPSSCVFRYDGSHRRGLLITHESSYTKLEAVGTIDFDKYAPVVIYPDNNNEVEVSGYVGRL
ncbi:uncharacterized protein LOC114240137 [Bombyx mandarina]|uniref:Uncharacterized protein LOC114240137 n=1 Tax=Bombyx mandarina TaxID=7092 RepID=A0A6J2JAP4_BOMMA|nr:uncharacterized protein LOC114240137 [Bombyx mandarina]